MEREVKLYLAEKEVEFNSVPDILYNFKSDDITSPSAVKNTYSKSISIPATPNNNKIFGSFYKNDFEGYEGGNLSGVHFDPRKRMPFVITVNGATFETGYSRLEKITQNKSEYNYQISLYGGLGDFFYELEYGEDAGKRKMSSLIYTKSGSTEEIDIDFTVNSTMLYAAWNARSMRDENSKYSVINFAPCYDGLPSNFSADKVLVNYSGITQDVAKLGYSSVTEDGRTYITFNNYYIAELPKEYTQAEMREYRSWMQRPVLGVKKTIEAICNPINNGGYEVVLDPEFFNNGNSYYRNAWITLPLISELKSVDYSTFDSYTTHSFTRVDTFRYPNPLYVMQLSFNPALEVNASKVQMNIELLTRSETLTNGVLYSSANVQNPLGTHSTNRCFSGYILQLCAYAGDNIYTSKIGASEAVMCTSPVGNDYLKIDETGAQASVGDSVRYCLGRYEKYSGNVYKWSTPLTLTMDIPAGTRCLGLSIYPVANLTSYTSWGNVVYEYGDRLYGAYTSTAITTTTSSNSGYMYAITGDTTASVLGNVFAYIGEGDTIGYTGAHLTKNTLLDTDYSPCDFLLSYAKLFGLYFVKDPVDKKISILTRENFFNRESITDITDYIDRSSVEITPLSFETKWYNWGLESVDSEYESLYESGYGKKYGDMDVDTNYEFNSDEKTVLEGNIFKSAIQALERSNMFYTVGDDDWSRPWMHNSYKYTLYDSNNMENTKEISIPRSTVINRANLQEGYSFYDLFSKPVFHSEENKATDGKNVLLLMDEFVNVGSYDYGGLKTYITDDVPEMGRLNSNEACWLYTQGGNSRNPRVYGSDGNVIAYRILAVPHFTRFLISSGSTYISNSLDFGVPETLYVPGITYGPVATMYNFFWNDYMEEIFSKNSRIMKCKMLIKEIPSVEWLRRFYYFDNTIWRMITIKDWNVTSDKLTDVEFVRVKNITKYTSENPSDFKDIYLSIDDNRVALEGGTIAFHIKTLTPSTLWSFDTVSGVTPSQSSGSGDYDGTFTIGASETDRLLTVTVRSQVFNDSERIVQV